MRVEGTLNNFGYALLQGKSIDAAIGVFELNTRLFPEAFNTWDSLGEAYMIASEDSKAITCYEESLELNPENTNAAETIACIRGGGE